MNYPVSCSQNTFVLFQMPKQYRKYVTKDRNTFQKGEIKFTKEQEQNKRNKYIIEDEKDKGKYESKKFYGDELPQKISLMLTKITTRTGDVQFKLAIIDSELECYTHQNEAQMNSKHERINQILHAKKKHFELERIVQDRRPVLQASVPFQNEDSQSESLDKKNKNKHLIRSDSEKDKKRKKVKKNSSDSQNSFNDSLNDSLDDS
ncbi:hypothetical protein pb186bvf_008490 [Paramecium bursaria]